MAAAAKRLMRRKEENLKICVERRKKAQEFAKTLASELAESAPDVKKIWGFGSTFEEWRNYRMDSDLDLAIEGGVSFFLENKIPASEFEISLINLEEQPASFSDGVRKNGVLLYEKK